jgi:ATP-dependent Clp protease protease subunit
MNTLNTPVTPDPNSATERGTLEERMSFQSRFVLVFGEIDDKLAMATCRRLLALSEQSEAPITMLVSSPGGHVESGDVIHDMIRFVRAPVTTVGSGWVASAGCHIFLAPPKERRVCLPNTRFMIHQPAGGAGGQATDIAIQAKEILRTRERIARVISVQTGKPVAAVLADMERDFWMSADEAVAYGIVSRVIRSAVEQLRQEGVKAGMVRPITLWPFPKAVLRKLADRAKFFLACEMSMGQMVEDVMLSVEGVRPVYFYGRSGGNVPTPAEVVAAVKKHL